MPVNKFSFNANAKDGILYSCNRKELVRSHQERIDVIPSDGLGISLVSDRIRNREEKRHSKQDHILVQCSYMIIVLLLFMSLRSIAGVGKFTHY